jgi:hypothetical protein
VEDHSQEWREITVAKAYRLLKAVMNTAVEDGMIRRNPCRIKGAGQEESPERPVLTTAQVYAIAEAISPRYRAPVLLATFGSLRWGELAGPAPLRRRSERSHDPSQAPAHYHCGRRSALRPAQVRCRAA